MRVAHDLVVSGRPVLEVATASRIDVTTAVNCLSSSKVDLLVHVDGLADHAEQILEILQSEKIAVRIVVLASERGYRSDFLNATLAVFRITRRATGQLSFSEARQLVERYRQYGLTATFEARNHPGRFARLLQAEPIAIAVCHILDDYRPMQAIVSSLWNAASDRDRFTYLAAALAHHCYSQGIGYGLLQEMLGTSPSVSAMFGSDRPLRLAENAMYDDYVVPLQSIVAEQMLAFAEEQAPKLLLTVFVEMAGALAPHVNRRAVMKRTPEARLAGRLFDSDRVVRPILRDEAERFYIAVQEDWDWNSRYWEQRALLIADADPELALKHARHAVATERHPHTLTTLGKVLFRVMDADHRKRWSAFSEGFALLTEAIRSEAKGSRITIHPYSALFGGVLRFLESGARLNQEQRERLDVLSIDARRAFPHDPTILTQEQEIRRRLAD